MIANDNKPQNKSSSHTFTPQMDAIIIEEFQRGNKGAAVKRNHPTLFHDVDPTQICARYRTLNKRKKPQASINNSNSNKRAKNA